MAWVQTATGRRVDLVNPDPKTISMADVARSLAGQCRYFGGTTRHYSVAEHSLLVAFALEAEGAEPLVILSALLHDAPEAFLLDLPHPLKESMPEVVRNWWHTTERRMGAAMEIAFGVPEGTITRPPEAVKRLDVDILSWEVPQFMQTRAALRRLDGDLFRDWSFQPSGGDRWTALARDVYGLSEHVWASVEPRRSTVAYWWLANVRSVLNERRRNVAAASRL